MQNRLSAGLHFICIGIKWNYECIVGFAAKEILSLFRSHSLPAEGVYYNFLIMAVIICVETEKTQGVIWSQCSSILERNRHIYIYSFLILLRIETFYFLVFRSSLFLCMYLLFAISA